MRKSSLFLRCLTIVCAMVLANVCLAQQPRPGEQAVSSVPEQALNSTAPVKLTVGPGDVIDVRVFGVPDLTTTNRVSESGMIRLPLIGSLKVQGLTTAEIERLVASKYTEGKFLNDPQVSVDVKEFHTAEISINGEINRPGVYPYFSSRRLLDLLSAAGGLSSRASRSIVITRHSPTGPDTQIALTLPEDPSQWDNSDVELYPGDSVSVGRSGMVYVLGSVQKPGAIPLENGTPISAMRAITLVSGPSPNANLNNARILRKKPDGSMEEVRVPLQKIMTAKLADVTLLPDDILYVPVNGAKAAMKRTLDAIIQVGSGVAVVTAARQ